MIFFIPLHPESDKSKDWEQQISQMKVAFEKQLQSERTLKTQVCYQQRDSNVTGAVWKLKSDVFEKAFRRHLHQISNQKFSCIQTITKAWIVAPLSVNRLSINWQRSWTGRRSVAEEAVGVMTQTCGGRRRRTGSCSWSWGRRRRNSTAPSSNTRERSMKCRRLVKWAHVVYNHSLPSSPWEGWASMCSGIFSLWIFDLFVFHLQQLSEESQMRIELQMALDSKDSDIEQLRILLQSLSVKSLDSASVNSGPEFDTDDPLTGKSSTRR